MHFKPQLVGILLVFLFTFEVWMNDNPNYVLTKEGEFYWLNRLNIIQLLKQNRIKVIFYTHRAAICPNCKAVEKTISELIPVYGKDFPLDPNFFLLNCDHDSAICEKRLRNRKLPALEIRIGFKDVYYHGDFSPESLEDFLNPRLTDRFEKYDSEKFMRLREQQQLTKYVIAVFKNADHDAISKTVENLMHLEYKDHFFYCDGNVECLLMFVTNPQSNLLLLKYDSREFLTVEPGMTFIQLVANFNNFKDPLFIPFGVEFEKSVMQEMKPTLIYIVDRDWDEFEKSLEVFKAQARLHVKYLHACIIKTHELTSKQMKLYNQFAEMISIDHYPLPLVMMVEENTQTKQLVKYFFEMDSLNNNDLQNYIDAWRHRLLKPTPRNEYKHPHYIQDMRVISYNDFDFRVFVSGKDSVLLVHRGFEECETSTSLLKIMKELSEQQKYQSIRFMIINGIKNDLPIEVERIPCFLIFADDLWEHPLQFSKSTASLEELMKIIDNRHELIAPYKPPQLEQEL